MQTQQPTAATRLQPARMHSLTTAACSVIRAGPVQQQLSIGAALSQVHGLILQAGSHILHLQLHRVHRQGPADFRHLQAPKRGQGYSPSPMLEPPWLCPGRPAAGDCICGQICACLVAASRACRDAEVRTPVPWMQRFQVHRLAAGVGRVCTWSSICRSSDAILARAEMPALRSLDSRDCHAHIRCQEAQQDLVIRSGPRHANTTPWVHNMAGSTSHRRLVVLLLRHGSCLTSTLQQPVGPALKLHSPGLPPA